MQSLSKDLSCYIERIFTVVAETENFLHLSFVLFSKILSSSSLDITSELEISNAVDSWLAYDFEERKIFASKLLQKVRLCLISNNSLKCILRESSAIRKDEKCVKLLRNALKDDSKLIQGKSTTRYRYCDQDKFNILVCGGRVGFFYSSDVHKIDCKNLKQSISDHFQLSESLAFLKAVYLRGEVFVFYGKNDSGFVTSVNKYSIVDKKWQCVYDKGVHYHDFCACGLIDKIYVLGGITKSVIDTSQQTITERCLDTKNYTWKQISKMRYFKCSAACSPYQGKVVVSGGYSNGRSLSFVEAYDHTVDEWVEMPRMVNARHCHSQITVKNKLFIIGIKRESCEVYDSDCKKFVLINKPIRSNISFYRNFEVVSIGNKIIVYDFDVNYFSCYDVEKDEWSEEDFELAKNLAYFSCVKVPQLDF